MNKILLILIILFLFNCGGGDQEQSQESSDKIQQQSQDNHSVDGFFSGRHVLALLSNLTKDSDDTGYVCISDTGSAGTAEFYFRQSDGFINAVLPQSKMRYNLSELSDTPYCKFRWNPNQNDFKEAEWVNSVVYVVVCLKPNQLYRKK